MLKRLPISLKIDDDDGDFYYGLIEEKRKNRELTTLILNLLKLYHTDENVRKAADDFMVSQNPYLKIHEELQRIAFEHKKQTTSTGMIGDFARNEMKRTVEQDNTYEEPEEPSNEVKPDMALLMSQISQMVTDSVSKAMSEAKGKETIEGNAPVLSDAETSLPVDNGEPKAVPKSFKKMMSSVK